MAFEGAPSSSDATILATATSLTTPKSSVCCLFSSVYSPFRADPPLSQGESFFSSSFRFTFTVRNQDETKAATLIDPRLFVDECGGIVLFMCERSCSCSNSTSVPYTAWSLHWINPEETLYLEPGVTKKYNLDLYPDLLINHAVPMELLQHCEFLIQRGGPLTQPWSGSANVTIEDFSLKAYGRSWPSQQQGSHIKRKHWQPFCLRVPFDYHSVPQFQRIMDPFRHMRFVVVSKHVGDEKPLLSSFLTINGEPVRWSGLPGDYTDLPDHGIERKYVYNAKLTEDPMMEELELVVRAYYLRSITIPLVSDEDPLVESNQEGEEVEESLKEHETTPVHGCLIC